MITFGDYFLYKRKVYRIFTNYHPKNAFVAQPLYKIMKNSLLKKNKSFSAEIIPKKEIEAYYSSKRSVLTTPEVNYLINRLKLFDINNVYLTGSRLLASYGLNIDTSKSDIDLVVRGKTDSKKLLEKISSIYNNKFISYKKNIEKLYTRRKIISGLNIDRKTIEKFESLKPLGSINNIHVNITPSYKVSYNVILESLHESNAGFFKGKIKIKDISHANTIPGFCSVDAKFKNKDIEGLISNVFYFMLFGKESVNHSFYVECPVIKIRKKYFLDMRSNNGLKILVLRRL